MHCHTLHGSFLYIAKMSKKKKKHSGHYCKICGCRKSNEQFSGNGHAAHVCKECQSLPKEEQADLMRCNEVERAAFKYPMSRQDWELLEKYAKKYKDKESGQFAQSLLDEKSGNSAPEYDDGDEDMDALFSGLYEEEKLPFSEADENIRREAEELLADEMEDFMACEGYIPEGNDLQKINEWVLGETSDANFMSITADETYNRFVQQTLDRILMEWRKAGVEVKTYKESLIVMETERLLLRRLTKQDLDALCRIMGKPEVMYAWEHGFSRSEVRKWINRQLTRYKKDGFGYLVLVLKETGAVIGQAGLMKSEINGSEETELGYILDDACWHKGYATEAAARCLEYAFSCLDLDSVCCSIRPENEASVRVTERLGMERYGSHTVLYNGKDMPHVIYRISKEEYAQSSRR